MTRITYTRWQGNGYRNGHQLSRVATDLATQFLGTGRQPEGWGGTTSRKNPTGSILTGTAWDGSGRSQRFTKPLLAQRCDGLSLLLCHARPPRIVSGSVAFGGVSL